MSDRAKRIGIESRHTIVPRTATGPKSSVYGENVKSYGAGEHPSEEEREAIAAEDPLKKSVNSEAGLGGTKFAEGEQRTVEKEEVSDADKGKSINEIAGIGGESSGAGEKTEKRIEEEAAAEKIEEKAGKPVITEDSGVVTPPDDENKTEETEEKAGDPVVEEDTTSSPPDDGGAKETGEPTGEDAENESEKNDEDNKEPLKPSTLLPPPLVLKGVFESMSIAKIKEFAVMNELDLGDARLKAEFVEVVSGIVEEKLPNSILGHSSGLSFVDYVLYLFESCGLRFEKKWLPKAN